MKCVLIALAVMFSGLSISAFGSADDTRIAGPDLIVSDVYWCDMFGTTNTVEPSITSGQPYTVLATIENVGTEAAGAFSADLYIDDMPVGSTAVIDGLMAQDVATVSWSDIITSAPGPHTVLVVADPDDSVAEPDADAYAECDNALAETFDVTIAEWTFAVYADADNNLEYYGVLDFLELADVGTSPEVNLVYQLDRAEGYYIDYGNWTDTNRFLITDGMEPWEENAYEDLGEVNMGDEAVLSDFACDTFDRFRAAKTCLVLWDHGANWYGGCCRDIQANDSLMTDEMRGALTTVNEKIGARIDIIGFDACVMASVEVCYAFEDLCVDFVASESLAPANGWPYDNIAQKMIDSPTMGSEELCHIILSDYVAEYIGTSIITMSAFRVDVVCDRVKNALSALADELIACGDSYYGRIKSARNSVYGFDTILTAPSLEESYSADLYCFASELITHITNEKVQVAAYDVMGALEDARIALGLFAAYKPYNEIFGMMVFWPDQPLYLEEYASERLALDTSWDEFLLAFYAE